jgi:hypothetical protein
MKKEYKRPELLSVPIKLGVFGGYGRYNEDDEGGNGCGGQNWNWGGGWSWGWGWHW